MEELLIAAAVTFIGCFVALSGFLAVLRLLGIYTIVDERTCHVYTFFGKVVCVLDDPGFYFLFMKLTWRAPILFLFGQRYVVDLRVDQEYLRSQPVNSEEGAPMGIGIWYEMYVSDPVSFLFKNTDPRGSLSANVTNAAIRTLSNLKLACMLENRHEMSQSVRQDVSPKSHEWGYKLGSVYIRKVHFRDREMITQIEAKVVNRLRQVTSAIKQDGANQVSVISSTAEKKAAAEFAKAAAIRPRVIGQALQKISEDKDVAESLFEVLECERLLGSKAKITLLPVQSALFSNLLAASK